MLYVSDLDGTLLQNNATLSDFSKRELTGLLNNGLQFTVASARSVVAMQKMLAGIPFRLPVIEFNGAFISDLATGRHEVVNEIDKQFVPEIMAMCIRYNCIPFVSSFNGIEDCLYYERILNDGIQWYYNDRIKAKDKRLRHTSKLTESFDEQVVCFTIIDRKDALTELAEQLELRFKGKVEVHFFENQYSPGWYWLTVHDRRATKDQAIKILMDQLGLSQHELTVFGDNSNDIKMFRLADHAVAVSDATDELKQHASSIIGSNEEDSVVRYLITNANIPT